MIDNFLRVPRWPAEILAAVLRVLGAVAVLYALMVKGWTGAGIMALTLPGMLLPKFVGLKPWWDVFATATLFAAGFSNIGDLYERVPWWDLPMHIATTGVVAALFVLVLVYWGVVASPRNADVHRAFALVFTLIMGLALAAVWEIVEWLGFVFITDEIRVDYHDTITDMIAGGFGALLAGTLLTRLSPGARCTDRGG